MKIIDASYEILTPLDYDYIIKHIERCGRTCYASFDKICEGSAEKFIKNIINSGHESVLEHYSFTVKFIVDRAIMAELTRHRLASFSVQSSRYCNYSKDKFGNEIKVIKPCFTDEDEAGYYSWLTACSDAEFRYFNLLNSGWTPEKARDVLPQSTATEVVMTANIREMRHILKLRCFNRAHPQIKQVMVPLLKELQERLPVLFEDIDYDEL